MLDHALLSVLPSSAHWFVPLQQIYPPSGLRSVDATSWQLILSSSYWAYQLGETGLEIPSFILLLSPQDKTRCWDPFWQMFAKPITDTDHGYS